MTFTLTLTGQLGSVLALTCALILMLPDGEAVKNSNLDIVCNEDCTRFKCDVGQTCNKVRPLGKTYDCFECRNCTNLRKYSKTLMPDEVYTKDEECVHIKVTCLACPDCAKPTRLALTSSREASPENAALLGSHDVFGVWGALGVSVVVNLLLLSIIVNSYKRNKRPKETSRDDEAHEAMMDGVEMQQVERF